MNAVGQRYSGKVALVAGASRGIGAATARAFAAEGAAVVLLARSKQAIDDVALSIRWQGGEALAIEADVGDESAMARALDIVL